MEGERTRSTAIAQYALRYKTPMYETARNGVPNLNPSHLGVYSIGVRWWLRGKARQIVYTGYKLNSIDDYYLEGCEVLFNIEVNRGLHGGRNPRVLMRRGFYGDLDVLGGQKGR